jgi:hypothetical protein
MWAHAHGALASAAWQVSYVKTFALGQASDDIDLVLHAVGVKMGFKVPSLKKQHKHHFAELDEDKDQVDVLRSAQHLIKTYRAGALGKFVLDQ